MCAISMSQRLTRLWDCVFSKELGLPTKWIKFLWSVQPSTSRPMSKCEQFLAISTYANSSFSNVV